MKQSDMELYVATNREIYGIGSNIDWFWLLTNLDPDDEFIPHTFDLQLITGEK